MDHQRSSPSRHSQQSTPARHICSLCGKSRSKRYHDQHPLTRGHVPEPGICSRSKCAKAVNELLRSPRQVIIYETHYHYHSSSGPEGPPPNYAAAESQLPYNMLYEPRRSSGDLSPIREEPPPPVNFSSGSEDIAAELSGESSLAGRVELPDNRCSRRCAFRGLSPIPEESPPPVNFLKKPTLQKKKNRRASED
ncbi:hypothetical protein BDZ45DRAFT_686582 [Acephala macrosclerotiorum]|nr:hypothetical protein BDZ45DRAFT_686582 [Acephala macrosclerotiorum]